MFNIGFDMLYKKIDTDNDGKLTKEEIIEFLRLTGDRFRKIR